MAPQKMHKNDIICCHFVARAPPLQTLAASAVSAQARREPSRSFSTLHVHLRHFCREKPTHAPQGSLRPCQTPEHLPCTVGRRTAAGIRTVIVTNEGELKSNSGKERSLPGLESGNQLSYIGCYDIFWMAAGWPLASLGAKKSAFFARAPPRKESFSRALLRREPEIKWPRSSMHVHAFF